MTTEVCQERVYNFSAGPAVMPVPVLQQIRDEMLCLPGCGASILEISHRSEPFIAIQESAKQRLIRLLNIPSEYDVLFLQGGSRLQFSMVPMNFLRGRELASYLVTGTWGATALVEAKREGNVQVVWDGKSTNYDRLPDPATLSVDPKAAYLHFTSNETIQGVQFAQEPNSGSVPLVCDVSSDFLSRPIDVTRYGLIYACAQKNAGPAGVTVVIIRKDWLASCPDNLPGYISYQNHAKADSMWNTPPTFAIYVLGQVANWLEETIGGLDAMATMNRQKANLLYSVIDRYPELYVGHAQLGCRSLMNVTFRLPNAEVEKAFLSESAKQGMDALQGHRSVGGIRASIYNAMPREGVECLAQFMTDFAQRHA